MGETYPFKSHSKAYADEAFTLSVNADREIGGVDLVEGFDMGEAIKGYIREHKEEFKETVTKEKLYRWHGTLAGRMCILYENYSGKKVNEEL